jgi:hypothetical protein
MTITARSVHATIRLPLDEMDLLLRLDRDLDGQVSSAELDAARAAVAAYINAHLQITADRNPLPLSLTKLVVRRDAGVPLYMETDADGRSTARIGSVAIRGDFLAEVDASHKTQGEVRIGDRTESFVFQPGVTFERRVGADWFTSGLILAAAMLLVGALWLARRRTAVLTAALALIATIASADVIMSAPALNAMLKTMERLTREGGPEAMFKLGVEADGLASLMNQEVESHGMQERALLDLALSRTKELGIAIAYNREKKKFFYDGAAFRAYLRDDPRGAHASAAEFALLSYQFYQSTAKDAPAIVAASEAKKAFLARYPHFEGSAEVRLFLAVDYQDLFRHSRDARDAAAAAKYRRLMRDECLRIERLHPRSEQADAARQMLRNLQP